ncbi:toxin CSTX-20-like [Centruroides sculpturatus]|uniref:toxin CSTX-20-like n=1 Tax=Centruroides sculpturatus TaxID=218467 RepID=UPI000C6E9168|nr:toxin CSTX-20-like [Centruroides sculpturatus]
MIKYILLVSLVIVITEALPKPCFKQIDCAQDECCLKMGNVLNLCRKRGTKGGKCSGLGLTKLMHKDVYIGKCPCVEGLDCKKKNEGLLGKIIHTCQGEIDEENPDETSDEDIEE